MSKILLDRLKDKFGSQILETLTFHGDEIAVVANGVWKDVARFLRDDPACQCNYFVDLSAVDFPDREDETGRFEVYAIFYSVARKHRIRVKTRVAEGAEIDTLTDVFGGADWQERECFDMFGVKFRGHPDLRRILMYEEFQGHPLRKDYPADKAQPLVPYRDGTFDKLGPFLHDEGMPLDRTPPRTNSQGD